MNIIKRIRSWPKPKIIFFLGLAWILASVLVWLIFPTARKGPLGFGPPAPMTTFQAKDGSYSISYSANWVAFELTQGSHGDKEVIAFISVSGRQAAYINIARRSFPNGALNDVVAWGQSRAEIHPGYGSTSLQQVNDGKMNGFMHEYTRWQNSLDKVTSRCQDFYVFTNDIGYSLSFCSQESDWSPLREFFTEMRQSFSVGGDGK